MSMQQNSQDQQQRTDLQATKKKASSQSQSRKVTNKKLNENIKSTKATK